MKATEGKISGGEIDETLAEAIRQVIRDVMREMGYDSAEIQKSVEDFLEDAHRVVEVFRAAAMNTTDEELKIRAGKYINFYTGNRVDQPIP